MKKIAWVVVSTFLIILVLIIVVWYWWYNTPHIIEEKEFEKIVYEPFLIFISQEGGYINEKILNISYKGSMCKIIQFEFPKIISEDNVTSFLNIINITQITKKNEMKFGYNEYSLLLTRNGTNIDLIGLWKEKKVVLSRCNQKEDTRDVAWWFVEKYG